MCFFYLRLVYPMLPVSVNFQFSIATTVFSNVYFYIVDNSPSRNLSSKCTKKHKRCSDAVLDLPISSIGWSLGPQNLVMFLTQLHSISEYWRILNSPHHHCLYLNWLNKLPSSSSCEDGELGGGLTSELA